MCEWDGERKGRDRHWNQVWKYLFKRERKLQFLLEGWLLLFIRSISPWLLHFHLIAVGHRFGLFRFSFLMDFVRDMMKRSNRPHLWWSTIHVERHLYYISKWRTQRDVYPSTCVFYKSISPLNLSAFCTHVSNVCGALHQCRMSQRVALFSLLCYRVRS